MHNVIPQLSEDVKKQIKGGVLFGDTKNKQSSGKIDGFPPELLSIICASDDGVCWGNLAVTAGHVVYTQNGDVEKGAKFLIARADAALKKSPSLKAVYGWR
jgi:cutinase